METLKLLSSDGMIPLSIAALVCQVGILGVSFFWFRKAFDANKQRIDKELDEIRVEVHAQSEKNKEIGERLAEISTDIKWIKRALSKK